MLDHKEDVMKDLKSMLEYYQALGYNSLPLSVMALTDGDTGTSMNRNDRLLNLREVIGDCHLCKLSKGRTNIVFGTGSANAKIMFIGEAPGKEEDLKDGIKGDQSRTVLRVALGEVIPDDDHSDTAGQADQNQAHHIFRVAP